MKTTNAFRFVLAWVIGAFCAVLMSMSPLSAALVDGQYVPVGNDSFYHARRVLDAVADPGAFYQFDTKIHVPEGSMLTWPWGYDWLLAKVTRVLLDTGLASDPMKVLDYAPVFAILISVGLVVAIAAALELSWFAALLLALSVAFSSLTQSVHGVGNIDHHYVEYIFVLAALLCGLKWLRAPDSRGWAAATAVVMGTAPAFHNGLFIVQLPLLGALALLWMRDVRVPKPTAVTFAAVLVATTLAVLIPSEPFRQGTFDFYFLSWFHLYVACCSAALVVAAALVPRTRCNTIVIATASVLAVVPLISQALVGSEFLSGELGVLPEIAEVKGVLELAATRGLDWIVRFYSPLIFVAPAALVGCIWVSLRRETSPPVVLMCVYCVFGLVLLFLQFRLHVYGSLALVLPWVVLACRLEVPSEARRRLLVGATAAIIAAAYVPAVKGQLFEKKWLGGDVYYALTRPIYPAMAEACASRPGVLLTGSDLGHYVRFHTECSVIADNFLIMPLHIAKFQEVRRLLALTPDELLNSGRQLRYVFVSVADISPADATRIAAAATAPSDLTRTKPLLAGSLLFGDPQSLNPRLRLISQLDLPNGLPMARLFEVIDESHEGTLE